MINAEYNAYMYIHKENIHPWEPASMSLHELEEIYEKGMEMISNGYIFLINMFFFSFKVSFTMIDRL